MNKVGRRKWKSFSDIVEQAKQVLADKNISFDEIQENTGVESEFSRILFDDATQTHQNVTKILDFLKVKFVSRKNVFYDHNITESGSQLRIRRTIKPKCTMYYDKGRDDFFKFRYDLQTVFHSETYTNIIKNEMKDLIYNYLEEKQ